MRRCLTQNRPYCTAHRVKLPGNKRRLIANCYKDREMSVITTYLNDNAQTPFVDLLSIRYTTNFATNTVTN